MNAFLEHINTVLNTSIHSVFRLTGGDINQVELLKTQKGDFVLKRNNNDHLPELFAKEAHGLEFLRQSNSFQIPEVLSHGVFKDTSYLLLEYIPTGSTSTLFWEKFVSALASLHSNTQAKFGLDSSNYIGSLVQENHWCDGNSEFYITQRLEPQFKMAEENGFVFSNLKSFYKNILNLIPNEAASMIHGDLWNGNYLVSETGSPVLIDPAVAYGPREMDLAMMQLFGGFPSQVFSEYNEKLPLPTEWEDRIPLWQLYYLLVHLNLFGVGYYAQVKHIVSRYS